MGNYRLQYRWASVSGLQRDNATTTLYATADDDTAAIAAANGLAVPLKTFSTFMSSNSVVALGGLQCKVYDMADPEPRDPISTLDYNLTPGSGNSLPREVALVLSFASPPVSGVPASRLRGRIYLPFIHGNYNDTTGRPNAAIVTGLTTCGADMKAAAIAAPTWNWVIHSTVNNNFVVVNRGFVDNEWDTQRRRGQRATSRNTF